MALREYALGIESLERLVAGGSVGAGLPGRGCRSGNGVRDGRPQVVRRAKVSRETDSRLRIPGISDAPRVDPRKSRYRT
ncbi:hypothetical protein [Arthrobacter livingstonensis]|nr:hypothetical protein [Arthrobacter livingstonensis]